MKTTQNNKKTLVLFFLIVALGFIVVMTLPKPENSEDTFIPKKPNYQGLAMLGWVPNSYSRPPTPVDNYTGINLALSDGRVFALYESRNWTTLDYGKTFVWRIK